MQVHTGIFNNNGRSFSACNRHFELVKLYKDLNFHEIERFSETYLIVYDILLVDIMNL